MNTCLIIAATVWLHVDTVGYGHFDYVNTGSISMIQENGRIFLNHKRVDQMRIWDEESDRYLDGAEVFELIRECDRE